VEKRTTRVKKESSQLKSSKMFVARRAEGSKNWCRGCGTCGVGLDAHADSIKTPESGFGQTDGLEQQTI